MTSRLALLSLITAMFACVTLTNASIVYSALVISLEEVLIVTIATPFL